MPTKTEWKYIIGGAFLNVVLHHYFLNMGLERTTGTNAGLILGTGPVLTVISVSLILRNLSIQNSVDRRPAWARRRQLSRPCRGGLAGLALGDIFVFISILVQVLSFLVISKAARTLDPRLMTAYMMVIGSVVLFIISLIQEPGEIHAFATVPTSFWLAFAASGIIGTAVGHMLYNYSVGKSALPKQRSSSTSTPCFHCSAPSSS